MSVSAQAVGPQGQPVDATGMPLHEPTTTPCIQEREASYACLNEHNYQQDKCAEVFQKYQNCKKRWGEEKAYYRKKMNERG